MNDAIKRDSWGTPIEGAMHTRPCNCDWSELRGNTFYCGQEGKPAWKSVIKKCNEEYEQMGYIDCTENDGRVDPHDDCEKCHCTDCDDYLEWKRKKERKQKESEENGM